VIGGLKWHTSLEFARFSRKMQTLVLVKSPSILRMHFFFPLSPNPQTLSRIKDEFTLVSTLPVSPIDLTFA